MGNIKRSVNGRFLSATKEKPNYENHVLLVTFFEKASSKDDTQATATAGQDKSVYGRTEELSRESLDIPKSLPKVPQSPKTVDNASSHQTTAGQTHASQSTTINMTVAKRELSVGVGADGAFQFLIPEESMIDGMINLKAISPSGSVLHAKDFTYHELKTSQDTGAVSDQSVEMTMDVEPFEPQVLPDAQNPQPYKVKGRIIAFDTGKPLKNWTVFFHVNFDGNNSTIPQIIAAIKTDSNGYFSFYTPAGKLVGGHAKIAGLNDSTFPLALTSDSLLQDNQIVVFSSLDDIDQDDPDCACNSNTTPALPDAEDLVNSSAYSDDLGGTCVDFTTPNRSLEEFTYYSVVRTTEPEIKRMPYKKPPLLMIGDMEQAQTTPVSTNNMRFEKELKKLLDRHERELNTVIDTTELFNYRSNDAESNSNIDGGTKGGGSTSSSGEGQSQIPKIHPLKDVLDDGMLKWWMFEFTIQSYARSKSVYFPGDKGPSANDNIAVMMNSGSAFIRSYCVRMAENEYRDFYGKAPQNDNETFAFWYFAVSKYFEFYNEMPENPDTLKSYIDHVLTKTQGLGAAEWWMFYIDYNAYVAPNGLTPLEYLKNELSTTFIQVNQRTAQIEAELLEFLKLAISYFKEDYDRIPNTPEEIISYILATFSGDAKSRRELNGHHAIDWDETPTLYQNTTIAHGHILKFKQVWKADGYSLGDLLYSLPLAPCQKKQIAVFDWDRGEQGSRSEGVDVAESMNAFLGRDRDVTDIISTSLTENTSGGSKSKSKGKSFGIGYGSGAGVAGSGSYGPFSLGAAGGSSLGIGFQTSSGSSSSSAWQNSARNMSANSLNSLRDNVMQSASSVRSQRITVVQAVNQSESMSAQTEVIANHNHCHSMTVEYFEVLRHFAIEQNLADVQECLFVPLEMTPFNIHKILRWRDELFDALRGSELAKGFEALDTIKNKYMVQGTGPMDIQADEFIQEMSGMLEFQINIDRPLDILSPDDILKSAVDETAWSFMSHLPGVRMLNEIRSLFEMRTQAQREEIYREEILPGIIAGYLDVLEFGYETPSGTQEPLPFDITVVPGYEDPVRYMSRRSVVSRRRFIKDAIKSNPQGAPLRLYLRYLAPRSGGYNTVRRSDISRFYIKNPKALPARSSILFNGGYINYETTSLKERLFSKNGYFDDIKSNDPVMFSTNLNARELINPVAKNYELANNLITHLNDNLEYYHKVIWWQMDKDKRFMMLDGFVAPNSGSRSVASVVENNLVAIVGNNLVFPVVRGMHLDPTYAQDADEPVDLFAQYAPTTPVDPFRISVPTRGVYAEAVMGSCNSCEVIDESRHWRFSEVPCGDTPTAIGTISTDTRRSEPADLTAKDLATNIINFQNPQTAPAPQGYGQAITALSTPGIFADMAGLDQNQKNAIKALELNQAGAIDAMKMNVDAAQEYAKMAKELVTQQQMLKQGDKVLRKVDKMEKDGKLSSEEAKKKRQEVLDSQIKGNSSGGKEDSGKDTDGGGKKTGGSSLLPSNPKEYASYTASSGDSGDSVSFTTLGNGESSQEDGSAVFASYKKPKDIIYSKSWKKSANTFKGVFDDLLKNTSLAREFLDRFYASERFVLEMSYQVPSAGGDFDVSHDKALGVTHARDYIEVSRPGLPPQMKFLDDLHTVIYINPTKEIENGRAYNDVGRALVLLHECAHAAAQTKAPVEALKEGEQSILLVRNSIESMLVEYANYQGISLSGQQESFTGTTGTWMTSTSLLLSYYGLLDTVSKNDLIGGREYINEFSKAAFGEDLLASDGSITDVDKFNERADLIEDRIFNLTRV
ncbi:hypothetical protein [Aureibacter tunicatorum]|uniref:Uncharacterized protein n=1 Tax=Aureibacter tunicatorum TaxID=866807 RepID=A0AAE3XM98_9BACT|nr:hypothetical protein [Aureibacter tunicatorum]MDR6238598.1 hypothetical protein [Aureibacter tunicatorum]